MANIDTELQTIAEGIYGEDVRGAIHDAIYKVNVGGGGGGGTADYNDLSNRPKINNVTLSGNKTASDLGLATSSAVNSKITEPTSEGTNGQALVTDGHGGRAWATVGGGGGGSTVEVTQIQTTGTHIADIKVDGTTTELYAPTGGGSGASWGQITGTLSNQTDLSNALGDKVDKVSGKGLSTEDYTSAEKTKLGGIENEATKTSITMSTYTVTYDGKNILRTAYDIKPNNASNYSPPVARLVMTISNVSDTTYLFTDEIINDYSYISVFTDTWGDNPSNVEVNDDVVTVTFAQAKTRTVTIWVN